MKKKLFESKEVSREGGNEVSKPIVEEKTIRQIKEGIARVIEEAKKGLSSEKLWREGREMTGHGFELSGIPFNLIMNYEGSSENPEGDYYDSTEVPGGWDIYIDYQPEGTLERRLFHEILEIHYRKLKYASKEAHQATLSEENRVFGKR